MNEDIIADLKQFIAATISQQLAGVAMKEDIVRLEGRIVEVDNRIARVEQKLDDVQAAVADALDVSNEGVGAQLKDHEQRKHSPG